MQKKYLKTSNIPNIQHCFQESILSNVLENQSIQEYLNPDGVVSPLEGLSVYYNGYRLRLIEILANDYPKLVNLMTKNIFENMAKQYIETHPSTFFSVRNFGCLLPEFLQQHSTYGEKPYFSEMATFEWLLGEALDAEDAPMVTLEELKAIPAEKWSDLKFSFQPSFQQLLLHWNIPEVWQQFDSESVPSIIPNLTRQECPQSWMIVRSNFQSAFRATSENEAFAMRLLHENTTFGDLCEKLCDRIPQDQIPYFTIDCLQNWIKEGLISKIFYTE